MQRNEIHLDYSSAKFHRRVFANLFDFMLFAIIFVSLFLACRGIVTHTKGYQDNAAFLFEAKTESGLYVKREDDVQDIVAYLDGYSASIKRMEAKKSIEKFYTYALSHSSEESYAKMSKDYDDYRLKEGFGYQGVPYYVKDGDQIKENEDCKANNQTWFEKVHAPFINEHLQGFLITEIDGYLEATKTETIYLFVAEILPSYLLAGILIYLIPPLFLKRGRMTLGKAMYRIGLADKRLLVCPFPRFLGRFFIFYFGELVLSVFTLGIPYLVSFSLMAFSKKKQGFPDYMLGLYEVDLSKDKLYFDYTEIRLNEIGDGKKAVEFEMEKPID